MIDSHFRALADLHNQDKELERQIKQEHFLTYAKRQKEDYILEAKRRQIERKASRVWKELRKL